MAITTDELLTILENQKNKTLVLQGDVEISKQNDSDITQHKLLQELTSAISSNTVYTQLVLQNSSVQVTNAALMGLADNRVIETLTVSNLKVAAIEAWHNFLRMHLNSIVILESMPELLSAKISLNNNKTFTVIYDDTIHSLPKSILIIIAEIKSESQTTIQATHSKTIHQPLRDITNVTLNDNTAITPPLFSRNKQPTLKRSSGALLDLREYQSREQKLPTSSLLTQQPTMALGNEQVSTAKETKKIKTTNNFRLS